MNNIKNNIWIKMYNTSNNIHADINDNINMYIMFKTKMNLMFITNHNIKHNINNI